MIKKLHHKEATISNKIQEVFQASYSVEAKLLNAIDKMKKKFYQKKLIPYQLLKNYKN